ncbi:MAG TPA: PepSY domain-containing protein [Advenella sp.]|nr:PepSY domain-containing protein [Advenella sp.]
MKKMLTAGMIGLLIAAAPATGALAYQGGHRGDVSPAQAMRIAERAVGGQAYSVEPDHYRGRRAYSVDVRKARRVVQVDVDARNGRILHMERHQRRAPVAQHPRVYRHR